MKKASWLKFLFNLYPPLLGAGIHVKKISPDFRELQAQMNLRWYNRNYVKTHFGGSLFSMTDPFIMTLHINILGKISWARITLSGTKVPVLNL
ncbi:MAG: DUF4442 domain-containing protein [Thermoplasmata archaeon]